MAKKSVYTHPKLKREYTGSYDVTGKKKERVFVLSALTGKKDDRPFSSPKAAIKAGWAKVR